MIAEIPITADLPPTIPWDMIGLGAFGAAVVGVALYFSWRRRMVVVVSASRTVIPPFDPRDDNPIFDETGRPLIGGFGETILDAIHSLERKIDKMSGNLNQAEADIQTIATANAKMQTDLATIKTLVTGLTTGTVLTQADIDALHAAAGVSAANTAAADELAATQASAPVQAESPPSAP
jgi:hypothetical protein